MTYILVVDDEPQILRALRINLKTRGYEVDTVSTGVDALTSVARRMPDAMLLDLGLPDMDGIEVVQGLRGWTEVPIVVVSGRGSQDGKVEVLDAGADDFVTKPFSMEELLARVRAVLRRRQSAMTTVDSVAQSPDVQQHDIGPSTVDLATRVVTRDGANVRLTPTEWGILELLLRHPNRLMTTTRLLLQVWGEDSAVDSGHLRFHIARLRRKLEADPQHPAHIITEYGTGYRFIPGALPAGQDVTDQPSPQ